MKTYTTRCYDYIRCITTACFCMLLLVNLNTFAQPETPVNIPGVAPVMIPTGGFSVDGDVYANFQATGFGDWVFTNDYPGTGGLVFNMTTPFTFEFVNELVNPVIMAKHWNDPYSGTDPTRFLQSNKINDNPEGYTWGPGGTNNPAKNEINNAIVVFTYGNPSLGGNSDDLWAICAGDRATINGSSYIDFEFLQNSLAMTGQTSGSFTSEGPHGGRTIGDILVTLEFVNGGKVATVIINKWTQVGGSYMYVVQDNDMYEGSIYVMPNLENINIPWMAYGQTEYLENQFAEAAVNLSEIFDFDENCGYISTVFVRTRTSGNSATAELTDLAGPPFEVDINLNELTINCPDDVFLPSCTSMANIEVAYEAWVDGFTYYNGTNPVDNINLIPALPEGIECGDTITFTYQVTDDCGIPYTCTSTFGVAADIEPPVFINPPSNALYACIGDVPAPGMLGWTDNCGGMGEVLGVDHSNGGSCPEIITRTWTITDACGNSATATQIITVDDNIAPVFATPPTAALYACIGDVPAPGMLAWTDNCDGRGEVLGVDVSDGETCPETITRTWTYTDACGNIATVEQIITVDDNIAPVFANAPQHRSYSCYNDVPAPGMLAWTDNCDGAGEVLGVDVSNGMTCPDTITRTWTYTDACGNVARVSQAITVWDRVVPVFAAEPEDALYACIGDVPAPGMLAWTDNCDGEGEVIGVDVSDGETCPEIITRKWTYTDACGNVATVEQIITVDDNIAPVFAQEPADALYSCIDDVPAPGMLAWTDNCDGEGEVLGVDVSDGETCPETITRTWTYTDACGNIATVEQIITVDDNIAPVFAQEPEDALYACIGDVPAPGMLAWTDNCDGEGEVLGIDVSDGETCPEIITRTWSYTDACGNIATVEQIITVDDNIAPVFAQEPADALYSCIDDVPAPGMLAWTDNCDGRGEVLGVDVSDGETCPEIITRTWTYTDACGNIATVEQIITVDDNIAPVFAAEPEDALYACISDVPDPGMLAWTDNCDGEGEVLGVDYSDEQTCPETITRTWTYTDACGNIATVEQIITVDDNIAPVFAQEPEDALYSCIDDVPAPGMLAWTDNCDGEGEVLGVDVSDGETCPEIITRTWTYTDACGNIATVEQIITVDDNIVPVFAQEPADALYSCIDDVPAPGMLVWTDNCDGRGEVLGVDYSDEQTCPETITRTWTYTDACGNVATVEQIITVDDNIAPVFAQEPADALYSCIDDVPAPGMLVWTDNCDGRGEVLGIDYSDEQTCPETITRTWTYTDACGNIATVEQIITVDDNIAPVFAQEPADALYSCIDDVPTPGLLAWTDNCDGEGQVLGVDRSNGQTCPEIITRTWTYTDACGNCVSVSQIITVDDNIAPVFAQEPADATYNCLSEVPRPGMLAWTDNCNGSGEVLGVCTTDGNTCPMTITRSWTYTDACGNTATAVQIITVDDKIAPVFAQEPDDATYNCISDVPAPGMLAWTDNCDGEGEVLGVDRSNGQTCPEIITRTWTYTDACGNCVSVSQIITVDDNIAPVFAQEPDDATYSCLSEVPRPGMLAWTDNCDGTGEVLGTCIFDGNTCPMTITRSWTYTDACGNTATAVQMITVDDNEPPVLTSQLVNLQFACAEDVVLPNPVFTDNCTTELTEGCYISGTTQTCADYDFPVGTTKVCFWAKDACGNRTTVGIDITILPCDEPYCTLTQGFYCNPGGLYCDGTTTTDLLNRLLTTNLVLGQGDRTFTIPAGGSQCVMNLLPGGGTPEIIPTGGKGCDNTDGMLTNKGRIKNSLLAQAITLGLNLRLDTDLGDLQITSPTFYTVASSDCYDENARPVAGDTLWYTGEKAMPASVLQALGGKPTVNEIFNFANLALGGVPTEVSLGDITTAICIINEAFDECRFIYFITEPVTGVDNKLDPVNMVVAPNPFTEATEISFTLPESSKVRLSVYNMQGNKVSEVFQGECQAGLNYTYRFKPVNLSSQNLILILETSYGFYTHKIIKMH